MDWIVDLIYEPGVAHSILLIAITIALGLQLGKIQISNVSLGVTWVLFVGIFFSHFGFLVDPSILGFVKEFGLILFVFSIGLQVGPGFFSSLKKGGLKLNLLATSMVLLSVVVTYIIHKCTGTELSTMVGIMSGAVTNTPGLGAAHQTYTDISGESTSLIDLGYAIAYPLAVVGIISSSQIVRFVCRIKLDKEQKLLETNVSDMSAQLLIVKVKNPGVVGKTIAQISSFAENPMVVSRVKRPDGQVEIANNNTVVGLDDLLRIVTDPQHEESIVMLIGERCSLHEREWETKTINLISKRIVMTKPKLSGQRLGSLHIRSHYGVNITRVNRAGIDLVATYDLQLQMGDRLTVVGAAENIEKVADILGNSMKQLERPNLIPIFIGIFIGVIVGSIPIVFPGIPQPIKLGLAGGPLLVAILIARYGPYYRMVTYTTTSANMMVREIGICLFLAAVGLGAGESFGETLVNGGYMWIGYGLIITLVPILIVAFFARLYLKLDFFSLMGLVAGSTTDPPALAYANAMSDNDRVSVSYATVYPLTMFLRVLVAQLLIILSF